MAQPQPVGSEAVPSLSDTINRGFGDQSVQQATLRDPKNPRWSGAFMPPGQAQAAGGVNGSPAQGANSSPSPARVASTVDPGSAAPAPLAAPVLATPSSPPMSQSGEPAGAGEPLQAGPADTPSQPPAQNPDPVPAASPTGPDPAALSPPSPAGAPAAAEPVAQPVAPPPGDVIPSRRASAAGRGARRQVITGRNAQPRGGRPGAAAQARRRHPPQTRSWVPTPT